jgi:ubiquinone biosynthesis protein COQ9
MKKKRRTASQKPLSIAKNRKILAAVLARVPFEGWTDAAYEHGLQAVGFTRKETDELLPRDILDIMMMLGESIDEAMQKRIETTRAFAQMRVRDKIAFAVRARLEALAPHREALHRLLVWYAMPMNLTQGIKRLYRTVDLIWIAIGDTSTDYNYYTKRLLLSTVVKSTMLFWLGDDSKDYEDTWAFLDRRIAEIVRAGKVISLVKEWKSSELVANIGNKLKRV